MSIQSIFDDLPDRSDIQATKVEQAKKFGSDVLPMGLADMDYRLAPCILEPLEKRLANQTFGYTDRNDFYYEKISQWLFMKHGISVATSEMIMTTGVIHSLNCAIRSLTKVGDPIFVQIPAYHPFVNSIKENGRKVITAKIVGYENQLARVEESLITNHCKAMILCNPHNPLGILWTRQELTELSVFCQENSILLISDEIHGDIVYSDCFVSLLEIPASKGIGLVLKSPCKTFNTSGLKVSYAVCRNPTVMAEFCKEVKNCNNDSINLFGLTALAAAYSKEGSQWCDELNHYLQGNRDFVYQFLAENMSKIICQRPDSTYFAWLDFTAMNIHDPWQEILQKARILTTNGSDFGVEYASCVRLNFATSRKRLTQAMERLGLWYMKEGF